MKKRAAKRRPNHDGSAPRLRRDGRWACNVSLGFLEDGKPIRRTVYGATAEACTKAKTALMAKYGRGLVATGSQTLGEWLTQWLEMRRPHIAKSTHWQYQHRLERNIPEHHKRLQLKAVKRADVLLLDSELARRGISRDNRAKTLQHLRAALETALSLDLIHVNPAHGVKVTATIADKAKRADPVHKALTDAETDTFLTAAEGDPLYSLFYMMFSLGLRVGEALGLRWSDVDFSSQEIHVRQQVKIFENKIEIGALKTMASYRSLALPEDLAVVLEGRRWIQDAERDLLGEAYTSSDLVFTSSLGTPLDRHNVNRSIRRICQREGLRVFTSHACRHTNLTALLRDKVSAEVVAALAGHSSPVVTLTRYRTVFQDEKRLAVMNLAARRARNRNASSL
ncbi:MAG: site-specific integrase [Pleurocapsa sp. SU_196_0]|nr:site-specific integrase [Pleurocapsa sp. SU_196_0]